MRLLKNKKGSSTVLLSMIFVTMMLCISLAVVVVRGLVVKSECEVFGRVWAKAILSEYDVHLLEDYNIMAYWGNEAEVQKRIDSYIVYSASNKLDASIDKSSAELAGYELANPDNFKLALKKSLVSGELDAIANEKEREARTEENTDEKYESRMIKNSVVLDTLPSQGIGNSIDIDSLISNFKSDGLVESLKSKLVNTGVEFAFVRNYMGNHVTKSASKDGYFCNEWEYIINGKCDDDANLKTCKTYISAIRNALNLAYLYKDPEKRAIIMAVAECLTPGAAGTLTQAAVAEAWALIETKKDVDTLMDNGRVPLMKNADSWQTDLDSVLRSDSIESELTEEGKQILNDSINDLEKMEGANTLRKEVKEGQTYDDYLLIMLSLLNDNVRTLRIMDLIQINMKYRYYEDFNMIEYYVGTRFNIKANGKEYEFEDSYK